MPRKTNELLCGDTLYALSEAYIAGARAMRDDTPHWANPHRDGSQRHDDWDAGHTNEAADEHWRFGQDVLAMPRDGRTIEDDPDIARDEQGNAIIPKGYLTT